MNLTPLVAEAEDLSRILSKCSVRDGIQDAQRRAFRPNHAGEFLMLIGAKGPAPLTDELPSCANQAHIVVIERSISVIHSRTTVPYPLLEGASITRSKSDRPGYPRLAAT